MEKARFYKRNLVLFIISLGLIIFSSVFLINSVNAAGINWAAFVNGGTAELNIEQGPGDRVDFEGTDGFPERINDEDNNSYITVTWNFAEEELVWPGWGWGPGIMYEAIVTFSEPVTLNRVEYVRRGHSGSSTCWYRYEGTIMSNACVLAGTEETYLYYDGGWQGPIKTRSVLGAKSTESIAGNWENVERVKVRVDINQWPYFPHLGHHYIYELRAFGPPPPPPPPPPSTCEYHNVWGWAWSDNIGWISFRCSGGASSHWQEVDDVVPDDLGTYVWTDSNSEQKDAYELQDPLVSGTIDKIRVWVRFQGTIKNYLRLNGVESMFPGSGSAGGGWTDQFTSWQPSRPGGGSWTWDDIRDLQVVAGLSAWTIFGTTYQGRLTQIYIEVDYSGGTLILRPDADGDYINIENPPAGSSVDYGVDIDETTGEFSGYAWSDNIGWISFNSGDLAGCPSAPCEARLDLNGTTCGAVGQVCGWARALAYGGGWDGWIKLRDSSYGVSLNPAPTPSEFREWAWGSDVIGWISFNCLDTGACGDSDYKVMTDITITLNNIPSATNLSREQTSGCGSAPIVRFSWDYSDDDNVPPGTDPQSAYEIQIDDDSNLDEDPIATLSGGAGTSRDYSPPSFGTTYWWRVRVQDTNGPAWSGWTDGPNFTPTKWPDPDFIWCPLEPDINETIQFCSVFEAGVCDQAAEPSCSDMTSSADNLTTCAAGCNLWEWDFDNDGTPEITSTDNPTYSYSSSGDYRVRLTVTDVDGRSCFKQHDVSADIPLPIWKEIPPF